jgi:hypothetical protein
VRVAIFGENPNDTKAIRELVFGLRPELGPGDVTVVRSPPTLTRSAGAVAVRSWVDKAQMALKAARSARGPLDCVLAHTDADGPADGSFAAQRSNELRSAGLTDAVAVVPVQAIESWWLLFPDATESVVPSWRGALSRASFNTDGLNKPKDELIRRTRAKQPKRPYEEADSPAIAAAITAGHLNAARKATSPSFDRFAATIAAC